MSKFEDLLKDLPDTEHDFVISNLVGNLTKRSYSGSFRCKITNVKTRAAIAKHRAMLNSGLDSGLDVGTTNLHHMISYLRYSLLEMPKWWKDADCGYELYDVNVIEAVYDNVLEFEKKWLESVWGPEKAETQSNV